MKKGKCNEQLEKMNRRRNRIIQEEVYRAASILIQLYNDYLNLIASNQEVVKECSQKDQKRYKKRKHIEIDDSNETLRSMLSWKNNIPENPPRKMFESDSDVLGECSKPVWKQVMESDVKEDQCRLMLGKDQVNKMMIEVFGKVENLETKGLEVSVYGPDGKEHKMLFKMWSGNTPVLTSSGWKKFVKTYRIESHRDFLIIWMFRHKQNGQICFAIDSTGIGVKDKLSKRILKETGF